MNDKKRAGINFIFWALCILYLFYLSSTTQSILFQDAFGYQQAAQQVHDSGLVSYWSKGIPREPLYSLFVAVVLCLADLFKVDYIPVLLVAQVFIFLLTLWLLEKLLVKAGIGFWGRWPVLIYAVFSPAFIYTVSIEWSEIVSYPLVLLLVLSCTGGWRLVFSKLCTRADALRWGIVMGLTALALVMVKAVAEMASPFLIIPSLVLVLKYWHKEKQKAIMAACMIAGFLGVFLAGINIYKAVNYHYNQQYAVTGRGAWALYGNTARGMAPLTQRQWVAAVLSVPTNGNECWEYLKPPDECQYWTFGPSDALGMKAFDELQQKGYSASESDQVLVRLSVEKLIQNPLQAISNSLLEGMKFMFWEYNAWDEFAVYPSWLRQLYQNNILYIILHYGMALLTFISVSFCMVYIVRNKAVLFSPGHAEFEQMAGILFCGIIIFSFILFYSFFYCSGRYAMPIAPLFLAQIAFFIKKAVHR